MKTTIVDTQAIAAGNGGTSTPVKLTLQNGTYRFSLELRVVSTRSITPGIEAGSAKEFTMWWARSAQDLSASLASVPSILRRFAKSSTLRLSADLLDESVQALDKSAGPYLYCWFEYPRSVDGYSVTITATEHEPGPLVISSQDSTVELTPVVSNGVAYTSGDSIGGKLTFASAVGVAAGASVLFGFFLSDIDNQKPEGTILIFNADPNNGGTTLTDNLAVVLAAVDAARAIESVAITTADWVTIASRAFCPIRLSGSKVKVAAGTSLYAVFVTTTTPTFASVSSLKITAKFLPINS